MPFNSEGNFTRVHNWEDDRVNGIEIVTDHHDEEDDNFAQGLNQTFLRDGRVPMENNLNMGGFKIQNCAPAVNNTDVVVKSQLTQNKTELTQSMNNFWVIGDIKASVQTQNHSGWLLCNGQAVSRTTYSALFALIGTKFGSGDGSKTFNLPDYRGKFLRGLGGNSASDMYTTQQEGLPNITGCAGKAIKASRVPFDITESNGAFSMGNETGARGATYPDWEYPWHYLNFDASKSNAIYGKSAHVTPINQAVNYFIKAKDI